MADSTPRQYSLLGSWKILETFNNNIIAPNIAAIALE